jgi:RNA polymerase sigma-70 factor, ECF subfamily
MRPQTTEIGRMIGDGPRCISRPRKFSCGSNRPASTMLWKEKAARSGHQPHVNVEHNLMSSTDTLTFLIDGVRRQDPERWREFDVIYRPMLLEFLRKRGLDDSRADDVVQQIFVKLLDKIQTYDRKRCRFRTWLFGLTKNTLIDLARRQASYKRALEGWARNVLQATPSDTVKMAEDWAKLHRTKILKHALETVRTRTSARAWACFEQRLLRNRPGAEIARELGITPNAVYVNSCRVLKEVTTICQEFDEDPGDALDTSDLS